MRILRGILIILALGLSPVAFAPGEALARQSMSFSPGNHARSSHAGRRGHFGRSHARSLRGGPHVGRGRLRRSAGHGPAPRSRPASGRDEGDAAKAVPGKGFTMENGVLTYPAPARFQPGNLRRR